MDLDLSQQLKRPIFSEYQPLPFEPGERKDTLSVSNPQTPIIDTILPVSSGSQTLTIRQQRDLTKRRMFALKKQKYATVESLAENSQMILNGKLPTSMKTFPITKLSRTLEAVSITNVKAFSLYSKEQLTEISEKLWLPTEIDYAGLELNLSNGFSSSTPSRSLFSIKVLKNPKEKSVLTSYPSFTFFPAGSMVKEDIVKKPLKKPRKMPEKKIQTKIPCQFPMIKKIEGVSYAVICNQACESGKCSKHEEKKEPTNYESFWPYTCKYKLIGVRRGFECNKVCEHGKEYCKIHLKSVIPLGSVIRCFKVRVYPNIKEKIILQKWFGDCRFLYNTLKDAECEKKFEDARSDYINCEEYLRDTPKEIRALAIKEYITGRDDALKKYNQKLDSFKEYKKYKKPTPPTMKFRFKKDQQCITIPKLAVNFENNNLRIYSTYLKKPLTLDSRTRPNKKGKIKDKKWASFVEGNITHDIKLMKTRTDKYYYCIPYDALPQVTSAQGVIALDKGSRKFIVGYSPTEIISIAGHKHDFFRKSMKRIEALKINPRDAKRRRIYEEKITNKITDLHHKTVNYLTKTYKTILLPKFNSKSCLQNNQLRKLSKFMLQRYSHYQFDQRLKYKAEITGSTIVGGSEYDTSQTCTNCFSKQKVHGTETYICPSCKLTIDRDVGASRNILVKHIKTISIPVYQFNEPPEA